LVPGPFSGAVGVGAGVVLGADALGAGPFGADVSFGPLRPYSTTLRTNTAMTAKIRPSRRADAAGAHLQSRIWLLALLHRQAGAQSVTPTVAGNCAPGFVVHGVSRV